MAIYQVTALQTFRAQECRNIFHYITTADLDAAQGQEVADAVRAAWVSLDDGANLVNDFTIYGINLRKVDVANLPEALYSFTSGSYSGTTTSAPGVPNQIALLVSGAAPTTFPRRVRTYLAGVSRDNIGDNGFWAAGLLADAAVWFAAMDSIAVTGDTLLRAAVRYTGDPPVVSASNRITAYTVKANPATQRRRRIGIGS